jgi:hypothetical protein
MHYPPDENHPEGRVVWIPFDAVAEKIMEDREASEEKLGDLHVTHYSQVRRKNDDEAAYPPVPPEKRFI